MFQVSYYETENGKCPVQEFLSSIEDVKLSAKVLADIRTLEDLGSGWGGPHVKPVEKGIWELRTKQSTNIARIFYFLFHNNNIVLLNGYIKKRQKIDSGELERAKRYKADYERRKDNEKISR